MPPDQLPSQEQRFNLVERTLIWLSGASEDELKRCPRWEKRKYEAFGATVLVPTIFGMIASAYAVSTLTSEWWVILPFALVWGFIILTIDRVLLATYRAFTTPLRKVSQFVLRFGVAVLMGFAIAHPLTLMLFNDTITAQVERNRDGEIQRLREEAQLNKVAYEDRIAVINENLEELRQSQQDTLSAAYVEQERAVLADAEGNANEPGRMALEEQVQQATAAQRTRLGEIDAQLATATAERDKTQEEIDFWQKEYEKEVGGDRSGVAGVGPRARSIEMDRLIPMREELSRAGGLLAALNEQRNILATELSAVEKRIRNEYAESTAVEAQRVREEQAQLATLRRQLEKQKVSLFTSQQEDLLKQLQTQIDSDTAERDRLRADLTEISTSAQARIAGLQDQPRADLLSQTLVLHDLFEQGNSGGKFAFTVYLMLAGLFMLIDTIPIIMKFFSNPGPYDRFLHWQEQFFAELTNTGPGGVTPISKEELGRFWNLYHDWFAAPEVARAHIVKSLPAAASLAAPEPQFAAARPVSSGTRSSQTVHTERRRTIDVVTEPEQKPGPDRDRRPLGRAPEREVPSRDLEDDFARAAFAEGVRQRPVSPGEERAIPKQAPNPEDRVMAQKQAALSEERVPQRQAPSAQRLADPLREAPQPRPRRVEPREMPPVRPLAPRVPAGSLPEAFAPMNPVAAAPRRETPAPAPAPEVAAPSQPQAAPRSTVLPSSEPVLAAPSQARPAPAARVQEVSQQTRPQPVRPYPVIPPAPESQEDAPPILGFGGFVRQRVDEQRVEGQPAGGEKSHRIGPRGLRRAFLGKKQSVA